MDKPIESLSDALEVFGEENLLRHINAEYRNPLLESERIFCNREWGTCPDSIDIDFPGEPHLCFHTKGHHSEHECGTCEAKLPLSEDERSSLEEPLREQ